MHFPSPCISCPSGPPPVETSSCPRPKTFSLCMFKWCVTWRDTSLVRAPRDYHDKNCTSKTEEMLQSLLWSLTAFLSPHPVPSSSMFHLHRIACVGCERNLGCSDGSLNLVMEALPAEVNASFISSTLFPFRSGICVWDSGPLLRRAHIFLAPVLSPRHRSGVAGDGWCRKFAL